jgi:uncharacterized membrane protein
MTVYLLAFAMGVIAGLRAMTPLAAVSWAARLGWLPLQGTPLRFLGSVAAPYILTLFAVVELITDQLPKTPSRKVPVQFGARVVSGGLAGAAIGAPGGALVIGIILGIAGAVAGTYGGAAARASLARSFGRDLPAALLEDAVAVGGAFLIIWSFV